MLSDGVVQEKAVGVDAASRYDAVFARNTRIRTIIEADSRRYLFALCASTRIHIVWGRQFDSRVYSPVWEAAGLNGILLLNVAKPGLTRLGRTRIAKLDQLRGLMIVLMVLDHVRDFFHRTALTADPLAMGSGEPALFATRWITHLCAPTFILLAGVSAWLQQENGKTPRALSRFLLVRGFVFIALEFSVVGLGFNFAPWLFFQVIWALGAGMMMLALVVRLPRAVQVAVAVAVTVGSPLLMLVQPDLFGTLQPLFRFGLISEKPLFALVAYPALPWFGLLLIGYLAGPFIQRAITDPRTLANVAVIGVALFVCLRALNLYGLDYRPWSVQPDALWTALSFLDVAKYPPSILFQLLTGSLAVGLLATLIRIPSGPFVDFLGVFGRTSLFTYLAHVWIAHGLAVTVGMIQGVSPSAFLGHITNPSRLIAVRWGVDLPTTYAFWGMTLLILWPLAIWYDRRKQASRHPLFSFL